MVVVRHASKILMAKRGEGRRDRTMILQLFLNVTGREVVERIRLCLRVEDGLGSVVGIATSYGLDGPGIESRWGRDFPHLS
jgi:hypothetical protein